MVWTSRGYKGRPFSIWSLWYLVAASSVRLAGSDRFFTKCVLQPSLHPSVSSFSSIIILSSCEQQELGLSLWIGHLRYSSPAPADCLDGITRESGPHISDASTTSSCAHCASPPKKSPKKSLDLRQALRTGYSLGLCPLERRY